MTPRILQRALAVIATACSLAAFASSVKPVDLDHIVAHAATAFQGRCIETHSERDAATGVIVTYTTFEVLDPLKGDTGATHTIKQVGGKVGDQVYRVDGVPTFTPGEEYVVFLYGKSQAGFSSPVGLSQGRFFVRPQPMGKSVDNGRDFREMLPPAAASKAPARVQAKLATSPVQVLDLDLDDFKQLVRERAKQ